MSKATKKNFDELLLNRAYDPTREPPPNQIVLRIENKNIGSLQNFITITGQQKNGKGKYIAGICAAAISRQEVFNISVRLPEEKQRVCIWDTEQSDYDFYKMMDNIKALAGVASFPAHFNAFNVREDEPADILQMMDRYLQTHPDTGLFVIDGLLDCLTSYNDEGESKRLINVLKKWTKLYNILAPVVLHRGKSNSTTLGHLGSMADRAAQSVLVVEKIKERNTMQLRAEYLRSADDFTPIEIFYNNQLHCWQTSDYVPPMEEPQTPIKRIPVKPHDIDRQTHIVNVVRLFNGDDLQSYDMLVQNIREIYAASQKWARDCVPHLMKEGLIFKTVHGYTSQRAAKLFIQS